MSRQTATETQLREWIEAGETHQQIADRLGRTRNSVSYACCVLGIESPYAKKRGGSTWKPDRKVAFSGSDDDLWRLLAEAAQRRIGGRDPGESDFDYLQRAIQRAVPYGQKGQ